MKLLKNFLFGGIIGFLNGLLGAGGGMIAVPVLKKELEIKKAHATSIAVILPMSIASSIGYIKNNAVKIPDVFPYLLFGIIGSVCGMIIMKKVKPNFIKKLFALVMIWAGIRMVFM